MNFEIDLRNFDYIPIEGRPDKRIITYAGVDLIVDVKTGYFSASYTCQRLDEKKKNHIRNRFINNDETMEYIKMMYNYDVNDEDFIDQSNNNIMPYYIQQKIGKVDPYQGYYFHPGLFLIYVEWLDKLRAIKYLNFLSASLAKTTLKNESIDKAISHMMGKVQLLVNENKELKHTLNSVRTNLDDFIDMFLEYSSSISQNIVAQDVTDYYIKFWIASDDKLSSSVYIRTFCGLLENWHSTKYDHKKDTLIYDKVVSCSINMYRAAIKPILYKLATDVKYRKFQIKRSDIGILIELIDRNIQDITKNNIMTRTIMNGLQDMRSMLG